MSRIAIVNVGMHGHVNPTLGFTEMLVRRGHDVDYYVDAPFAAAVERTGAVMRPYRTLVGSMAGQRALEQLRGNDPWKAAGGAARDRFLGELETTLPQLLDALGGPLRPDVVVYDFISTAAYLATRRLGIPAVKFFTTYASNAHYDLLERLFASMDAPTAAELAAQRARLSELSERYGTELIAPESILRHPAADQLVFMPRRFQPQGKTFDASYHFVGPCVRATEAGSTDGLLPPGDGPLLLISLGTIFNAWSDFYRQVVSAFGGTRWRVVMAIGPHVDAATLGELPANIVVRPHLPQIALLQRAALFVTHGGMNSTMEALALGVPLVVIPQMPEQEVTAERVAELGLGRHLQRAELTAELLAEAVEAVDGDPAFRVRAAEMGVEIAAAGGTPRAVAIIEAAAGEDRATTWRPKGADVSEVSGAERH